jgi:UDP-2,3-diacylglucosamine pyrophosphatase LpxH
MLKERRNSVRHRTLWLSDLHLGSPGCQAAKLVAFLRHSDCEQLYLVGDIFDGWKLKSRFYWTPDHSRVIKAILAMARRGTKVHYLTGNHDDFMRQFVRRNLSLGKIHISHEVIHKTADGRRLLVTHGDRFDAVIRDRLWLALAGDVAYEALMRASRSLSRLRENLGLEPWSLSAFAKHKIKGLVQYLSGFEDTVYYECKKRGLNGVICGHTHHAEARPIRNGVMSYNCGDWVESCTALREDASGHIEILQAGDRPHQPERPVSSVVTFPGRLLKAAQPVVFEAAYEQLRKIA